MSKQKREQDRDDTFGWEYDLYLLDEERAIRDSINAITEQQWVDIFPAARAVLPKILEDRERIAATFKRKIKHDIARARGAGPVEEYRTRLSLLIGEGAELVRVLGDIERLKRQIEYATGKREKTAHHVSEADIIQARDMPLTSLLKIKQRLSGQVVMAHCPLHLDVTPSFAIYSDNHYHCFGCNAHGDPITLIQRTCGLSFVAAVEHLNQTYAKKS